MFRQEKTTQELLDNKHSHFCDAMNEVKSYMLSGKPEQIDWQADLTQGDYEIRRLVELAVADMADTPAAKAVFDIAVHRLCHRNIAVADEFTGQFAMQCVEAELKDNNPLIQQFIESLRSKGVDNYSLALFWVTTLGKKGHRIFNWTHRPITDELIFEPGPLFVSPASVKPNNVFEEIILGLTDKDMLKLLQQYSSLEVGRGTSGWKVAPLLALLTRDKPQIISQFIESFPVKADAADYAVDWPYIIAATDAFDEQCIEFCSARGLCYPLIVLDGLRQGKYTDLALKVAATAAGPTILPDARFIMSYLLQKDPKLMLQHLVYVSSCYRETAMPDDCWYDYYVCAFGNWEAGGKEACMQGGVEVSHKVLTRLSESQSGNDNFSDWIRRLWTSSAGKGHYQEKIRQQILALDPLLVEDQLWESLKHKQKAERAWGVAGLKHESIKNVVDKAEKLSDGKADAQLGAIELLTAVGNDKAVTVLQGMSKKKLSAKVSKSVIASLESLGKGPSLDDIDENAADPNILATIESAKIKPLPKAASLWIDLSALPALYAKTGKPLSEKAISHLIAAQAKHKTINPAPDSMPVLQQIDREKSADFAVALLKRWLGTECNTADKWVITLAGILGDRRVLSALSDPIEGWVKVSRHKLAEYAAQAIALVPVDESLMLLDLLAGRYRSKYKNIGAACKAALEQAAAAQNISVDELADMIVPTLDFDVDYRRVLPDTDVQLVLQPDFKLSFFNPESDKETKTMPASLSEKAKEEIKTVRTLIRQTIKGQTTRLEQDLVRQRAWSTKRWQELFEVNPFLQSYASRLVWATLDENGEQTKLFRRYANGLLANAAGDMIELDKADRQIVMVHPLNLDDQSLAHWQEHLTRLKVKPPFPQLDRTVERLHKKHSNRKQISFTDGHRMASGTFRSRAEKCGWVRGSVVDGGGITSYYKSYPGALITIMLMVEETYIGQDPADPVLLGSALFVKAESVKIGSYTYDEPNNTDDPRVIAFGEVPAVVFSESLSDLKTMIVTKEVS